MKYTFRLGLVDSLNRLFSYQACVNAVTGVGVDKGR